MNKNISEAIELANGLKRKLHDVDNLDIVLCPSFTALYSVCEVITGSNIQLGAQDVYWQNEGAYTGEVSALMLKDSGCKFVIIGHSERRQHFFETNETVNRKVKAAIKAGLNPIVCVGETLIQREENRTLEVIKEQIRQGFMDISSKEVERLVIAYEPVWAIGTGRNATPAQAEEAQIYIRNLLGQMYNDTTAEAIRIQY